MANTLFPIVNSNLLPIDQIKPRNNIPSIILIEGWTAAGKSSFEQSFKSLLKPSQAITSIQVDWSIRSREERRLQWKKDPRSIYDIWGYFQVEKVIIPILNHILSIQTKRPMKIATYRHKTGKIDKQRVINPLLPRSFLIIQGAFALSQPIVDYLIKKHTGQVCTIYVKADPQDCANRIRTRAASRGRDPQEAEREFF